MSGKGDARRPAAISDTEFAQRWRDTFCPSLSAWHLRRIAERKQSQNAVPDAAGAAPE